MINIAQASQSGGHNFTVGPGLVRRLLIVVKLTVPYLNFIQF